MTPESRFQEDLDADSLDLVEAVLALEEEFGVIHPRGGDGGREDRRSGRQPGRQKLGA